MDPQIDPSPRGQISLSIAGIAAGVMVLASALSAVGVGQGARPTASAIASPSPSTETAAVQPSSPAVATASVESTSPTPAIPAIPAIPATQADSQVENAQGYDTIREQEAAGASTTPGGADVLPGGIAITPAFGTNYASADELQAAVGNVTMAMNNCPASTLGDDQRTVRVNISKPDFERTAIVNSLLLNAAMYAWNACPQPFSNLGFPAGTSDPKYHYDVNEIDIFLPDGTKGFSGTLGMYGQGDQGLTPGHEYKWQHLVDFAAAKRRAGGNVR